MTCDRAQCHGCWFCWALGLVTGLAIGVGLAGLVAALVVAV